MEKHLKVLFIFTKRNQKRFQLSKIAFGVLPKRHSKLTFNIPLNMRIKYPNGDTTFWKLIVADICPHQTLRKFAANENVHGASA